MLIRPGACIAALVVGIGLAHAGDTDALYKSTRGPHDVTIVDRLALTDPAQRRNVILRVLYPDGAGPYPVVAFSTGMFCYPQMYDRIVSHWASHGYVVIQPNHLDSPNNPEELRPDQYDIVLAARARDMTLILDALDSIARAANIDGRIDAGRAAVAGHSFGAVISMIKTGLYIKEYYRGPWGELYDDRYQVAVLMSGVGYGMKELADNAFEGLRKPLMASGGTNDIGRVPPGELSAAEWRMQPFLLAPIPGHNYSVITEGSDHYLGGLICNAELGGEPDHRAIEVVRAMTTAFLDAYIKDDAAAMDYLHSVDLGVVTDGFARYRRR